MLSGVVGFTLLNAMAVHAADAPIPKKAPAVTIPLPAVDGINGKIDGFGGSVGNKSVYGVEGTYSVPLQGPYGFQMDGRAGSLDRSGFGTFGGHLFWRNPMQALFGVYGDYTNWDRYGGVRVGHVAGEGAYYIGQFTLEGVAGIEFGNNASSSIAGSATTTSTTTIPPAGIGGPPGTTTTTTSTFFAALTNSYDIKTRFFDQVDLAYYPIDNWKAYVGHRYLGGLNAAAFGTEAALPIGHGLMASAFVEGRVGEQDFHGIWGGVKLYFGQSDKPLIARHRRDDPPVWSGDSLFSILNNQSSSVVGGSTQSSTTTQFCNPGETLIGGTCGFRGPPS